MKIGVFGNCQAGIISQILMEQLPNDEIIAFKAVHTMSKEDRLLFLEEIKYLDVLLHQPVSEVYSPISTEKILSIIDNKKSIIFPVIYFSPYFMDITYLKNSYGATDRTFVSDYHSRIIMSAFYHGLESDSIIQAFNSDSFFSKKSVLNNFDISLHTLKEKEKVCDITISHLIEKNYDKKNLFFTFNHPTGYLVYYVVNKFLSLINKTELNNKMTVKSIETSLGLKFNSTKDFYMDKKVYSLDEFIKISYEFYKDNYDLVKLNENRILPKKLFY